MAFKPFMKSNDVPVYVHKLSNPPPSITRNIPESINRRLSAISVNEKVFNDAAPAYQEALKKSGYDFTLKYDNTMKNQPKPRKTRRKIVWFNPPFSKNVKTNIGHQFLKLLRKHFPPQNNLSKIINKNTIKLSYRCLPNLDKIISKHNAEVLRPMKVPNSKTCNCKNKPDCPMNGNCLIESLVYHATVTQEDGVNDDYIGITGNTFKQRWTLHKSSFNLEHKEHATTLSHHIWQLKRRKIKYNIKWKVIWRAKTYSPVTNVCELCTTEKYLLLFKPDLGSLNNRNELTTHCRHMTSKLLDKT